MRVLFSMYMCVYMDGKDKHKMQCTKYNKFSGVHGNK